MATNLQLTQLSLIKINDFKGVVIRVYHFNNDKVIHFLPVNYLFFKGCFSFVLKDIYPNKRIK